MAIEGIVFCRLFANFLCRNVQVTLQIFAALIEKADSQRINNGVKVRSRTGERKRDHD